MFQSQNRISRKSRKIGTYAVLVLLISVLPSVKSFWGSNDDSLWKEAGKTFLAEVQLLEEKFPMQSEDTWLQITSTVAKTLKAEPPQHPAVITALLPPDLDTKFSTCFLHRIAISVNKAVKPVLKSEKGIAPLEISSQSFEQQSITDVRHNIDTYFQTQGKALLVLDIQNFTNSDNLQVFHGICDNFHSVDSRATILFPVRVPEHIYLKYKEWKHSLGGTISNEVLTESWKNVVNRNTGPALIARVADAVVLLNTGDTCEEIENVKYEDNYQDITPIDINSDVGIEHVVKKLITLSGDILKLQKIISDYHITAKNNYLANNKDVQELKINQKVFEYKFDDFIISETRKDEAEHSDFQLFKWIIYIAVVTQFLILSIMFAVLLKIRYAIAAFSSVSKKEGTIEDDKQQPTADSLNQHVDKGNAGSMFARLFKRLYAFYSRLRNSRSLGDGSLNQNVDTNIPVSDDDEAPQKQDHIPKVKGHELGIQERT